MLNTYIDNNKDEIIKSTQELIKIPSVYEKSNNPAMPFGKNVNDALTYMLNLGEKLGFRTKNIDGYCGYIEFGSGNDLVGIIGHLDVVPEGDNWTNPPFSATIKDNKIFGRGAIDDKGPIIASLYAMKAVMDNCKINKRVRLILGLNEENDWKCIEHYKQVNEELPSVSFSPDANFPCIYAEKGILSSYISMPYPLEKHKKDIIFIKNINCNNNALNVVPKYCEVSLEIDSNLIKITDFVDYINNSIKDLKFNIEINIIDDKTISLISHGVQAHAAHPDLGVNAISKLIVLLYDIFNKYNINCDILDFFKSNINNEYDGNLLGANFSDESGNLTLNVGNFSFNNSTISIGFNIRIPIHTKINAIEKIFEEKCFNYNNLKYITSEIEEPLYVPKNNFLVKALCNIFNEETNSNFEPIAIGGGTYARGFDNCVSFGPCFPGDTDMCHQTDEFIDIDKLILSTKIYAKAILTLSKMD